MTGLVDRPRNRQGRPRESGDHCTGCLAPVKEPTRRGLCGACYGRGRRAGTITTSYVDPQPAREHMARIYATGKSYRWIAAQAGTHRVNLHYVSKGNRQRISRDLADKILAIPVPESVDENRLKRRVLQTAGMRGTYVGVERRYRQSRRERGIPRRKRDPNRHSLLAELQAERAEFLAQFDAERDEFMRWLYEGTAAPVAEPIPVRQTEPRPEWLTSAACGECEQQPCACPRFDDGDLWIACLADHDDLPAVNEIREAA